MGAELKKTVGHAGVYTIGVILSRLISFVMLPVYTNCLPPSDYGVLELLEMTVIAVSIVAGLGIHNGLFKYYYECDNAQDRNELVSTAFLLVIGFYGLFCAIGVFSSSYLSSVVIGESSYASLFRLSFVNLFLQFLIFVPLAYVRAQQKSVLYVVVNTVQMVLQLSLNIFFVVYRELGVLGILLSTLITYVVIGLWMTLYAFARVGFRFSAERASKLIRFGAPFVLSGIGAFVMTFSDRLFIKHYWTISDVGIYSLAYKFGFLLMMFPVSPICNIWMAQRFEIVNKEGYERIYNQFLAWFAIVTVAVALGFSVGGRDLLRVMSASPFWPAHKIIPIIVLAYLFQAFGDIFNFGIFYSGKTKHIAYGTALSVVVILILSFALIPWYGTAGAAWATAVSFFVRLAYFYHASQRLFRIDYDLKRPIYTVALGILAFIAYRTFIVLNPYADQVVVSACAAFVAMGLFVLSLSLFKIISVEERAYIVRSVRYPRKALRDLRGQVV